ncbi:hypothetical protein ET445_03055 [Agromyces protaetiae]|uniref:Uncharacterized protein n=1 Tax=Agromyces protaetiae TaxID=2509455 RepID=A0A4P6FDN0_9MICO|nr:hypothetical protein [Agromyces protaetiae]QAY72469.1 hypothetical protein ET445_03055 [Agromyces protaetiae]
MPIPSRTRQVVLISAVAALATLVIGVLLAASSQVEHVVERLPRVSTPAAALGFLAACAIGAVVVGARRAAALASGRSRRAALERAFSGDVVCGVRHPALTSALGDLGESGRLASRFSAVADQSGVTFWRGGSRPQRAASFAWREVRTIRSDSMIAGTREVPVLVLRVRRDGSSIELPIIIGAERAGAFAVVDAPFFATLRSWKALHRAALAAEGLELPPLTAPIQIITPEQALAARG